MDNNYIEHHGILGMKWGVRRTEAQLARARGRVDKLKTKKKELDRYERAKRKLNKVKDEESTLKKYLDEKGPNKHSTSERKIESTSKKSRLSELSDSELRERVARLELEKRYKDLAASANPPKSNKGRKFVEGVLENSGKNIATQLSTYVMGTAVNKLLKDVFDDDSIINPKKGQKDK